MKFVISVDTEADNQWKQGGHITLRNLEYVPRFHALCRTYGFKPTYLITYEVAQDKKFTSWLHAVVEKNEAEVGAHMHPWTTPPFLSEQEKKEQTFPCDLDGTVFATKLRTLHNAIVEHVGVVPTSFRAGRWGISGDMIPHLRAHGYMVDSSVTPFVNWSTLIKNGSKKMDFRDAPINPYTPDLRDVTQKGDSNIVEIPMSIYAVSRFGITIWKYKQKPTRKIEQLFNKFFYHITWCRIFPETHIDDLISCYKTAIKEGVPVLQFMIHSSELIPGGSMYNRNDASIETLYKKMDTFFAYIKNNEIPGVTLSEYAQEVLDSQKKNK